MFTLVEMVDVDGCCLAVDTQGEGSPPVVLVHGSGEPAWGQLLDVFDPSIHTVTYHRPGLGGSRPLPAHQQDVPRTYTWAADQLRRLLGALDLQDRQVLVGHSLGGTIIEAYARRWPEEVAGLVFLDATDAGLRCEFDGQPRVARDGDQPGAIAFDRLAGLNAMEVSGPLPAVPAIVVTAAVGRWLRVDEPAQFRPFSLADLDDRWQDRQRTLARRCGGQQILARTAGHRLEMEAPQLVAAAIEAVVAAVRSGQLPFLDPAQIGFLDADIIDLQ
ncbi:MAG: alpha/beta fold hydrolase [Nocardioidaceae bacterium]